MPSPTEPHAADLAFAKLCAAGDRGAQRQLFSKYKSSVHGAIFRILGSNAGIDDAIQDAFVEIFRSLPRYRGEAALGTWIHVCAVRAACDHLSKLTRGRGRGDYEERTPSPSVDEVTEARDAVARLYTILQQLTPGARVAFVLSAVEGRTNKEVAELMDASEIATKVRVWRARRQVEALAALDPLLAPYIGAATKEPA